MNQPILPRVCSLFVSMVVACAGSGCASHREQAGDALKNASQAVLTDDHATKEPSRMRFSTYLLLDGCCKEAMAFYHEVFGGELSLTTVGESPMKDMFPPAMHGKVVNARLSGGVVDISASDWLRPTEPRVRGNSVCLYLSGGRSEEARAIFARLAQGAEATEPLSEKPFGFYGALNDRFGQRWMFQSDAK